MNLPVFFGKIKYTGGIHLKQDHFIIDHIEDKKETLSSYKVCHFNRAFYTEHPEEKEWIPMKRMLVDSDQKHIIYVVEINDKWEYVRFPLHLWKLLDEAIHQKQNIEIVLSLTAEGNVHKTLRLQEIHTELRELVGNMRSNANYGEGMSDVIEEHFPLTIQQFV
jgi:hypothetical protein